MFEPRFDARFSEHVQTGHEVRPASCTMGYLVSLPGVERPGRGVDHIPESSAEVEERGELNLPLPSVPAWLITTLYYSYSCRNVASKYSMNEYGTILVEDTSLCYFS